MKKAVVCLFTVLMLLLASCASEADLPSEIPTETEAKTERQTETTVKEPETTAEEQTETEPETTAEEQTEKETEKETEKQTEKVTKKQTEKVTEKQTEKVTEKRTEKVTEKRTEKVTEKKTEKVTEKKTEKVTEKQTEKVTEKQTEKKTDADTEPPEPLMVLDGKPDDEYTKQGNIFESTALYIYSNNPEKRTVDENGNSPFCRSTGTFYVAFDGQDLWMYSEIRDTTMFDADTEFVMSRDNPWDTDAIEIWYSFDGKKLFHVDTDAYGHKKYTDEVSRSVHFDAIEYAVRTHKDEGYYTVEFKIPGVREDGTQLKSGDTVYAALQINDLFVDPKTDPSHTDNLAFNGGHHIENFKKIVLK